MSPSGKSNCVFLKNIYKRQRTWWNTTGKPPQPHYGRNGTLQPRIGIGIHRMGGMAKQGWAQTHGSFDEEVG